MEVDAHVALGKIENVISYKEYVVTDKGAKAFVIVGIIAMMRGIDSKHIGEPIGLAYSALTLRTVSPSVNVFKRGLITKSES
jgi:hypothetical protein